MKLSKKLLVTLLCIAFVLMAATGVQASTINCWYAYEYDNIKSQWNPCDRIATYKGQTIKFSEKKLNKNDSFEFFASNKYAQDQWKSALGISMTNVVLMDSANLKVFGGTLAQLQAVPLDVRAGENGATLINSNRPVIGTEKFGGRTRTIYSQKTTEIAIVDKGHSSKQLRNTCTHEMGHGLGWHGHSKNQTDIMYRSGTEVQNLTSIDKSHLKQVY